MRGWDIQIRVLESPLWLLRRKAEAEGRTTTGVETRKTLWEQEALLVSHFPSQGFQSEAPLPAPGQFGVASCCGIRQSEARDLEGPPFPFISQCSHYIKEEVCRVIICL